MENHQILVGSGKETDSGLQGLLNRVFRCRHRRKSFPFTPRGEDHCYAVCLDCGQRLDADLQAMAAPPKPGNVAPEAPAQEPAQEKDKPRARPTEAPSRAPALPQPVPKASLLPKVSPVLKASPLPDLGLRNWRYDLLWVGLFVIGLSGGLYSTSLIRRGPHDSAVPLLPAACLTQTAEPQRSVPVASLPAAVANASVALPDLPSVPKSVDAIPKDRIAFAVPEHPPAPHPVLRLVSRRSFVVLGLEASVIFELAEHPGRLAELIQRGSLFTVPSGTAIKVQERDRGVMKVEIVEGSMAGREGWASASHVTSRDPLAAQPPSQESR